MQCYFCGKQDMVWSNDWVYDEIWGEGEGLVSCWFCPHCGAEAQFSKREEEKEDEISNH